MTRHPTALPPPPRASRPSRERWDAVVIGSGMGGCAAAALLARAGRRVLVLERQDRLGGILASFERDGFKLDAGSHLVALGARGPVGRLLRDLGLARPRLLTHPVPVRSRGILDLAAPSRRRGLPRVALEGARRLGLPPREVARLGRLLLQVLTLTPPELRRWERRTLDAFVRAHTDHPGTYFLLSFLASIFFVLPPWEVAASEAILALRHVITRYALSYVEGGMDALPHALLGVVTAAGGEVVVGAPVVAVRRREGGLEVATAAGDVVRAPAVACNVAPPDLLDLLPAAELPAEWVARVRAVVPSGNAHQLALGLSRPLVEEGCLIGGLTLSGLGVADLSHELMARTVADLAAGRAADPLAVYAPVPTNYDPTLAPPGGQLLLASLYGPTTDAPVDPPERWRDHALRALAAVVPGLEDALVFAELTPVPAVGAWMGRRRRGAIASAQIPGQVGRDRLPVTTPWPGLVLCGDGAGGRGIGLELATTSAREAAAALLGREGRAP